MTIHGDQPSDRLKFDLRLYVLVFGDPLRVYLHRNGGVKVAMAAMPSSSASHDLRAHLTNIASKVKCNKILPKSKNHHHP